MMMMMMMMMIPDERTDLPQQLAVVKDRSINPYRTNVENRVSS